MMITIFQYTIMMLNIVRNYQFHPAPPRIPVDEVVLLEGVQHNRDPSTEKTRQSRLRKP